MYSMLHPSNKAKLPTGAQSAHTGECRAKLGTNTEHYKRSETGERSEHYQLRA